MLLLFQITIEKSPAYFVTPTVPKRVYQMNPRVKLLLIVREPATRAISEYVHRLQHRQIAPESSFEENAFLPDGEVNEK